MVSTPRSLVCREVDVRVLHERVEETVQRGRPQPGAGQILEHGIALSRQPLEIGVPESATEAPPLFYGKLLERRIETHVQGALPEQPSAEGVDGPDEGAVDVVERPGEPIQLQLGVVRPVVELLDGAVGERGSELEQSRLDPCLEALPQLGRRFAGEGDGRDLFDGGGTGRDQRHHPTDERRRLAGSGAGLDEEIGVEIRRDACSRRLVPKRELEDAGFGHAGNLTPVPGRGKASHPRDGRSRIRTLPVFEHGTPRAVKWRNGLYVMALNDSGISGTPPALRRVRLGPVGGRSAESCGDVTGEPTTARARAVSGSCYSSPRARRIRRRTSADGTPRLDPPNSGRIAVFTATTRPRRFRTGPPLPPLVVSAS